MQSAKTKSIDRYMVNAGKQENSRTSKSSGKSGICDKAEKIKSLRHLLLFLLAAAVFLAAAIIILLHGGRLVDRNKSIGIGYEGLRVKRIMQILDLGETTGMGGAYYDDAATEAVSKFQEEKGLPVTGEVNLKTWEALGLTKTEWDTCGIYQTTQRVGLLAGRKEKVEAMIDRAYDYLGDPYVIGASGPPGQSYGVDCSGLVMQALYAAGIALSDINPVTHQMPGHEYESRNLWESAHFKKISYEERERGDLVFYANEAGTVIHVALYLGEDQVIEAWPDEVQISELIDGRHSYVLGFKRVF